MSDKPRTWQKKGEMKCKKKWHIQRLERSHEKRRERERERGKREEQELQIGWKHKAVS